jgi:hypothetical protein
VNDQRHSEIYCSICHQPVTLHSDTCADEEGRTVHKECYAARITDHTRPEDQVPE